MWKKICKNCTTFFFKKKNVYRTGANKGRGFYSKIIFEPMHYGAF